MVKAWGGSVVTTCSSDAMALVKSLGADVAIDYNSSNAWADIEGEGKYVRFYHFAMNVNLHPNTRIKYAD